MRKKLVLTMEDVKKLFSAAEEEARRNNWNIVIAVLDDAGRMLGLLRMDGSRPGNDEIAIQKARTSALTQRPSKVFDDWICKNGRLSLLSFPILPVQGGVPIFIDGDCVGSIGVSGVLSHQDEQVALAAIKTVFPEATVTRPGEEHA